MICFIIYTTLAIMGLGISMAKHGEPKGNYNFFITLVTTIIEFLLLWGMGVFEIFK